MSQFPFVPIREISARRICAFLALLAVSPLSVATLLGAGQPSDNILADAAHRLMPSTPGGGYLETRIVPVEGQPFTEAIEAKTLRTGEWAYSVQLQMPTPVAVREGDVMLAEFWIRTVESTAESGEGEVGFSFQQRGRSYHASIEFEGGASHRWQQYQLPFRVSSTDGKGFAVGQSQVCFRLGFRPQTIQLGGIRLVDHGPAARLESLPATHLTYEGRDPHAAWRVEAEERIRRLRMGAMAVRVVDEQGNPVVGASVEVRMKRSAFHFGSAVDFQLFASAEPDAPPFRDFTKADAVHYRDYVLQHFNQVTPENDLKWDSWEGNVAKRDRVMGALRRFKDESIRVHGHCLIWPGVTRLPADVAAILGDRAALDRRIDAHFTEILTQTRGLVDEWDVVNEPYAEREILNRYGETLVGDWFRLAHRLAPLPRLYLNDYANFQSQGDNTAHKDNLDARIVALLHDGAPVQGIGMQGHFRAMFCPPAAVLKELDRFARFGLPIEITEFDLDSTDDAEKADYTRDFLTACYSHPAVDGISCWGFWEGKHWRPKAAMIRKDWSVTPWGQAWLDLVEKQWRTQASGITDARGEFQTPAFFGDYEIVARMGGREVRGKANFGKDAAPVVLKLAAR